MTRARDFQRKRVYKAERSSDLYPPMEYDYTKLYYGKPRVSIVSPELALTLEECQDLVDRIIQSPIIKAQRNLDRITVVNGRRNAMGYFEEKKIVLPKWARFPLLVIHELCHVIVDDDLPWHGKEFVGLELRLIREFVGETEANELEQKFKEQGVQYEYHAS